MAKGKRRGGRGRETGCLERKGEREEIIVFDEIVYSKLCLHVEDQFMKHMMYLIS